MRRSKILNELIANRSRILHAWSNSIPDKRAYVDWVCCFVVVRRGRPFS